MPGFRDRQPGMSEMAEVRTLVAREHGLFERVMPTHMRILECVAARDAKGARRAMREHLVTALSIQNELVGGTGGCPLGLACPSNTPKKTGQEACPT